MQKRLSSKAQIALATSIGAIALSMGVAPLLLTHPSEPGMTPEARAQNQATADEDRSNSTKRPAQEPVGFRKNGILLVYPHDGSTINAPATYMTGTVAPGTSLSVNGQAVRVNHAGYFAHVLPLSVGTNQFNIVAGADASRSLAFSIKRPAPPPPVPADPLQIQRSSLQPKQDLGLQAGDMIQFSMKASPGALAKVTIGSKEIKLHQAGAKAASSGRDTAFGVAYQQSPAASGSDLYTGFYRVTAADSWQNEVPVFTITRGDASVREQAQGHVTIIGQPFVATTVHDDTIVRVGPGAGRTTPFVAGVHVLVDGFVGDSYRCEMASGKHLWIEKNDLAQSVENTGAPPTANVRTINIENEGTHGARVVIPLDQRLPYEVKQEITPQNRLILKVYGATADTDWITEPSTSSKAVAEATAATSGAPKGRAYPPARAREHNPVSFVGWQQMADKLYQVSVNLNQRQQWGFYVDYDENNLVLHVKGKPEVELANGSLRGLRICLDPGHGGLESGAIACSGTKEATVNLAIAKRAERLLKERGAEVVMTRNADIDVSLQDRVAVAGRNNADLLVSIHNNSLPDGRNPLTEHGTSSYYYHPQSLALAIHERQSTVKRLGFNDYHTRWQNLFLCRPSRMPAQLLEVGFLNNPDELAELLSEDGQERAALGVVEGVHAFLAEALSTAPPRTTSQPHHVVRTGNKKKQK